MKKITMKKHFFYFLFLLAFMGCDKEMKEDLTGEGTESTKERDENNPSQDGKWEDVIGLSQKSAEFYWRGDTVTILTDGPSWWMNAVEVNGTVHKPTEEQKDAQIKGQEVILKYDWLTIRTAFKKIELIADLNEVSQERTFNINLQSGDYFDHITGKQGGMLDGDWTDVIGLSSKTAYLPAEGGNVKIQTKNEGWWFTGFTIEGTDIPLSWQEKQKQIEDTLNFEKTFDWFTLKRNFKTIDLVVTPNHTGKKRIFIIKLQGGNYFDQIEGIQETK